MAEFSDWYVRTLNEECQAYHVREPLWSEAAAVGSRQWIEGIAGRFPRGWYELEPASAAPAGIAEGAGTYVLRMSNRRREGLLGSLRPQSLARFHHAQKNHVNEIQEHTLKRY